MSPSRKSLVVRFGAFRAALLKDMAALTAEVDDNAIRAVNGAWLAFKREVESYANEDPMGAEDPWTYFKAHVWATPAWKAFDRLRTLMKQRRPDIRAKRQRRDRQRYKDKLKAERSTPEARAQLAARRRAQRAAKKARDAQASEVDTLGTV